MCLKWIFKLGWFDIRLRGCRERLIYPVSKVINIDPTGQYFPQYKHHFILSVCWWSVYCFRHTSRLPRCMVSSRSLFAAWDGKRIPWLELQSCYPSHYREQDASHNLNRKNKSSSGGQWTLKNSSASIFRVRHIPSWMASGCIEYLLA